jgi:ketosteroid isomerase-like protein
VHDFWEHDDVAATVDQEPIAQVRAIWAAYARGGFEALRRVVSPDVEWVPLEYEAPIGADDFWEGFARSQSERISATVHGFETHGDCVLAHGSLRTFRDGGFVDVQPSWVYFFRGQRLTLCVGYATREAALSAIAEYRLSDEA